ncbi:MAG: hypothetical protein J7604_25785 [Sporocytophaga sp.]|uniref:hypothetical protein n=1 Tax=Sporocytophaga sp. TaxID=2231183 RepID=UPI001B1B768E|nr:hypothetical protein [Sporocytophaga sp.]MBO9703642.1 hypothetical protein [Sporocytophaga sp.]
MKTYFPYIVQSIPLLISLELSGLIPEFHFTTIMNIQFYDTYVVLQRWQVFMVIFLIFGYIMNLLIALINKLNKIHYNILLIGFNTSLLIMIVYISLILIHSRFQDTLLDKRDLNKQQLVNSLLNETITKSAIITGIFLLIELIVLYKTIRLKKAPSF